MRCIKLLQNLIKMNYFDKSKILFCSVFHALCNDTLESSNLKKTLRYYLIMYNYCLLIKNNSIEKAPFTKR